MTETQAEPAEGALGPEDMAPEAEAVPAEPEAPKSNKEVAQEVLAGRWSRGKRRRQRLVDAGFDPAVIKEEMAKILNQ